MATAQDHAEMGNGLNSTKNFFYWLNQQSEKNDQQYEVRFKLRKTRKYILPQTLLTRKKYEIGAV